MSQTRTRRKERITVIYLLILLSVATLMSTASAERRWEQCITGSRGHSQKRHLGIGEQKNITLEISTRITHQLVTHIYRILLEEVLGYTGVKIILIDDYNATSIMDRFNCLESKSNGVVDVEPEAMINLEVPVPPDFTAQAIELRCAYEVGTISPPGQFGWFIPKEFSQSISKDYKTWDRGTLELHWTHFRNAKYATALRPVNFELIERNMYVEKSGNKSYICNTSDCKNGWFVPDWCKGNQCAVVLAPDFNNTQEVIGHIKEMRVYVQVAWLGPNLNRVVQTLKKSYEKMDSRGFAILSWSPSEVVLRPSDFILVQMGRCDSLNNVYSWGCYYEKKRSGVFAWEKFVTDKSELAYELLKTMSFLDHETYNTLIEIYNNTSDKRDLAKISCDWVNANEVIWNDWILEQKNVIAIGGIFPISGSTYTGRGIVEGAKMAVIAINANQTILKGYKIELLVADGMCRADKVIKAFIDYLTKSKTLVGVLGPACSETVEPIAGLSKYYKMITISYSAEGAVFSDRDKYPYFLRTIGENKHYKFVYLELLKQLGWKRVAALTEDGQKYTEYIAHMQELLETNDVSFVANIKFPRKREKDSMTRYLEDLKRKRARIIIADVFDEAARSVMCEAYKLGMTAKQGYVWFLPTWLNNTWYNTTSFNEMNNEGINCTVANMIEAINGHFAITYAYYADDDDIMQENMSVAEWKKIYQNRSTGGVSNYAGYAYDGVWTYSLALDKLIKEDPEAIYNLHSINVTNKLTQIIKHIDFFGVSGRINFRGGTSRFSKINVMQWYKNQTRVVGQFLPNISDIAPEVLGGSLDLNKSAIIWLNSFNRIPDDGTPPPVECTLNSLAKFLNVKCEMAIIILNMFIILFIIVSLTSVIIVIKKRSKKYEKRVIKTERYMKSLGLQHLLSGNDYNGLDKWEINRELVVLNRKLGEGAFGTVYGGEANLSDTGWTAVAVKTLKVGSTTEQKLDFLSEAEVMKRFEHPNIVKLLGVCTKEEPVYTVMEFMLYGDLKTYLLGRRNLVNGTNVDTTDEVSSKKLTSMALDVARGLSYLAELKYVHRDVASRNCLLSGQRVVKLGDFGMTRPMFENDYYKFNRRGMLPVRWMAPESLALGVFTPSSDVWSYGVLLYEIITFGSFPFQGLTNSQVLEYVKLGNTITIPQGVKAPLEFLLKTCWSLDAKLRPTASELVEYLANNSRLISPCLDVPLASVQMEDTGQLEMQLPDQFRKCSSSLSFKNLPMVNGISSMSIHTPARRQQSEQGDSGISMQMEVCCPKEPLLPPRSDSISECSKYVTIQHLDNDSVCDQDDGEDYFPGSLINGHAISEV